MNAYERIQKAMKDNEKSLLKHIFNCNLDNKGYEPFLPGRAWSGAMDRLQAKGKIAYRKSTKKNYSRRGYWIIK